jgi:hypothetical protein
MPYGQHSTGSPALRLVATPRPRTVVYLGRGDWTYGPDAVASLRPGRDATPAQWRRINDTVKQFAPWARDRQAWAITREDLRTVLVILGRIGVDVVLSRHADTARGNLLRDAEAQLRAAYELTGRYGYDYLRARYGVSVAHGDAVALLAKLGPAVDALEAVEAIAAFGGAA